MVELRTEGCPGIKEGQEGGGSTPGGGYSLYTGCVAGKKVIQEKVTF